MLLDPILEHYRAIVCFIKKAYDRPVMFETGTRVFGARKVIMYIVLEYFCQKVYFIDYRIVFIFSDSSYESIGADRNGLKKKILECQGLDPQKLKDLAAFRELPDDSRRKYIATWQSFCQKKEIKLGKTPTKDDLYGFLGKTF